MASAAPPAEGPMHGCALFRGDEMLLFVEDVGRHNAIDTIAGWMWMHGDPVGRPAAPLLFYTTGRLTSEMVAAPEDLAGVLGCIVPDPGVAQLVTARSIRKAPILISAWRATPIQRTNGTRRYVRARMPDAPR